MNFFGPCRHRQEIRQEEQWAQILFRRILKETRQLHCGRDWLPGWLQVGTHSLPLLRALLHARLCLLSISSKTCTLDIIYHSLRPGKAKGRKIQSWLSQGGLFTAQESFPGGRSPLSQPKKGSPAFMCLGFCLPLATLSYFSSNYLFLWGGGKHNI